MGSNPTPSAQARKQAGLPVGVSLGAGPSLCDDRCAARRPGRCSPGRRRHAVRSAQLSSMADDYARYSLCTPRRVRGLPTRPCWPWNLGVSILEFRGEKIARESIYVTEGWSHPSGELNGGPPHSPRTRAGGVRQAPVVRCLPESRVPPTRRRRCRRRTWSCWPGAGTCSAATTTTGAVWSALHHAYFGVGAARARPLAALVDRTQPPLPGGGRARTGMVRPRTDRLLGREEGDCVERGYRADSRPLIESARCTATHEAAQAVATEIAVARRALWRSGPGRYSA